MGRPDRYELAYLDSCVFTRYFTRGEGWDRIQRILDAADAGQFELCASTFSLVECLSQSPSASPDTGLDARVLSYLDTERIIPIEFNRAVGLRARELHLTSKYRLGDAIHMASAIEAGADVLFTVDKDDFPIGTQVEGVWIDVPYFPGGPDLFDQA